MKRVYLDHAAATPVDSRVLSAMAPFWADEFANPSAVYKEGVKARTAIEHARKGIAEVLGIHADEIVFTGSATESCNLALFGTVKAWQDAHLGRKAHIIVSAIEHDAVLETARKLKKEGVLLTILPVDVRGVVNLTMLKEAITEDTVLISVMYANNEIGTIEPIREIAKAIRKWKKDHRKFSRNVKQEGEARYPLFHTDATQAVNYLDIKMPRLGVDLLTFNAAKIYGPKGIGLLAVLRNTPLVPCIVGGGQERGMRAATENVPLVVGFARAFYIARDLSERESERLSKLRDAVVADLKQTIPETIVNGRENERLPNNIHISLPRVDHEFLTLALDARGFAVATKSACNELDAETSHVLVALCQGGGGSRPLGGLRITMGRRTNAKDMEAFVQALKDILKTMVLNVK